MLDFRTLQDHAGAAHPQRPAVQGRGRGQGPVGLQRAHPAPARGPEVERVPDQPEPGAERGRRRRVDPEPRDRGERRPLLARVDRRSDRRRPALLPREPRASVPRTPSDSSCSASSRTSSSGCRSRRSRARCGARCTRRSGISMGTEVRGLLGRRRARAVVAALRRRRSPALRRAPRRRLVRDRRPVLARGRRRSPRASSGPTSARSSARSTVRRSTCAPVSPRPCPRPSRCRSTRCGSTATTWW